MKNWIEKFRNPEAKYRSHPFWSWNDKLEEDELRLQIRMMKESGHGGFFMHARDGLLTPYMSKEWFELVRACTDEAEKCGLEAWGYDESGWPSGSAGGAIPAMGDEYKTRLIRLLPYDGATQGDVIAYYAVKDDNSYRMLSSADDAVADGEKIMYAAQFTDGSYLDILNPAVVKAFIDHTYEGYLKELGGDFKKGGMAGFFTDEPQYALCRNPWTTIAEEEFKKSYGYSIIENIPALFLGRDGHESVRFDFWKMTNRLFTESFAKQIGEWCDEHGCLLTGHAMMEDNLLCQIHCTGGCMPMYEYMQVPGIDWLGRHNAGSPDNGKNDAPVLALQVGSVAAQTGKERVLTETFAMCGWDISFAEMRSLIEWQFLGGVNFVCQHLEGYTLRGQRKGDFPPSMFYQSPWWDDYKAFTDTVARLGKLLAVGVDDPGLLLIHPMHSIWLKYTNLDLNAEQPFTDEFTSFATRLSKAHIPYHLGDETVIARHGKVEGALFKVGKCSYHTVFLPSLMGLDRSTYELLMEFKKNGGRIASLGMKPEFIDGRPAAEELYELLDGVPTLDLSRRSTFMDTLRRYYSDCGIDSISVVGRNGEEEDIQVCRRYYPEEGYTAYFFVNLDRTSGREVSIILDGDDAVELRPDDMKLVRYPTRTEKGKVCLDVKFAPMESHFIIVGKDLPEAPLPEYMKESIPVSLFTGAGTTEKWRLGKDSDKNACLLEYCSVSDGESWSKVMHPFHANGQAQDIAKENKSPSVKYTFVISEDTDLTKLSDVRAVCEERQPARIFINGFEAPALEGEWWLDHSFSVHEIGAYLRHGENELIMTDFCHREVADGKDILDLNSPFGYMYLTGSFGVYFDCPFVHCNNRGLTTGRDFYITNRPCEFVGGNIVTQGHPFFAGHMVFEKDVEIKNATLPRHIEIDKFYGACARTVVNGKYGKLLAWGDFRDDITDRLVEGRNTIGINVTIGNKNLLGPHHLPEAETQSAGPGDFAPYEPSKWVYRYGFVKSGLSD